MNIHSPVAAGDKREAILGAALALFAERGFHGTAVPVIADRAGVGAGTVYRYFESKEAIVNALYQEHKQALGARLLAAVVGERPAREQFHLYWSELSTFVRDNPQVFEFLELHHHSPYLDAQSRAIEEQLRAVARERFEAFRRDQIIKDVPVEIMMALVHGAFVGLLKARDGGWLTLDEPTLRAAEQCVWEAIRR
jgi:TetR/AcrR family transcriptional regulator, repressor of fatR-cypB operon